MSVRERMQKHQERPIDDAEELERRRKIVKRAYDKTRTYCVNCERVTMHSCPYGPLFKNAPSVICITCTTYNPASANSAEKREVMAYGDYEAWCRDHPISIPTYGRGRGRQAVKRGPRSKSSRRRVSRKAR